VFPACVRSSSATCAACSQAGNDSWRYLYRAIDRSGALVDVMFSDRPDMAAAKAFFRSTKGDHGRHA
jgi:transposase-like protein